MSQLHCCPSHCSGPLSSEKYEHVTVLKTRRGGEHRTGGGFRDLLRKEMGSQKVSGGFLETFFPSENLLRPEESLHRKQMLFHPLWLTPSNSLRLLADLGLVIFQCSRGSYCKAKRMQTQWETYMNRYLPDLCPSKGSLGRGDESRCNSRHAGAQNSIMLMIDPHPTPQKLVGAFVQAFCTPSNTE